MNIFKNYFEDFLSLFFPDLCNGCGRNLFKNESVICTDCLFHLPYTNFHLVKENRAARQLVGRFPFQSVSSFLYFLQESRVQSLMHQLKYNHKPEVGIKLGELYGEALLKNADFTAPDLLIPVPLHASRLKKRGYNQAACFGQGLSDVLHIPLDTSALIRKRSTTTQTQKSRIERYENMKDVFHVTNPGQLAFKHILLLDDVMTTGATLEACSQELLKVEGIRISIATIACTE